MRRLGSIWLLLLAGACGPAAGFACEDDGQCRDGERRGFCEDDGFCSFAEDECVSGRRYGELAPDEIAGRCVPGAAAAHEGGTTGSTGASADTEPASTTTPGDTTSEGVGSEDAASSDESGPVGSSGEPAPVSEGLAWPVAECAACVAEYCCDVAHTCLDDPGCACELSCSDADCGCGPSVIDDLLNTCLWAACPGVLRGATPPYRTAGPTAE